MFQRIVGFFEIFQICSEFCRDFFRFFFDKFVNFSVLRLLGMSKQTRASGPDYIRYIFVV